MATLVRQVVLKNFKSIAACKVELGNITLLVGPNGSGKSNFIDALRLVSDALNSTLDYSVRQRGGINEVRRRSGGHPTHFAVSLRLDLGGGRNGYYAVQVGARPEGAFVVQREQARVSTPTMAEAYFLIEEGNLSAHSSELLSEKPKLVSDRLFLTSVSGREPFRLLFDALANMRFYSINPEAIKELQVHDSGDRLDRNGWNLAAVIRKLREDKPDLVDRIQEYLRTIVPGIQGVDYRTYGPRGSLEFRQEMHGQQHPWRFHAANMSDGTLRSLGILTALFQPVPVGGPPAFVAIEEPEITIHPGAAGVLMDALFEASQSEQILATTHSPDLLDHKDIPSEAILSVSNIGGETRISPIDSAAVSAIRDSLFTAGDLLRSGQLAPDRKNSGRKIKTRDLFGQNP